VMIRIVFSAALLCAPALSLPHTHAKALDPATQADCNEPGAEQHSAWCRTVSRVYEDEAISNGYEDGAYADYLSATRTCTETHWVDTTSQPYETRNSGNATYLRKFRPPNGTVEELEAPISACASGRWVIVRAGPLTSAGNTEDIVDFSFTPDARTPDVYGIDAYVMGRANEQGELIGNPPLYLQDVHGGAATGVYSFDWSEWSPGMNVTVAFGALDNHGDSQCTAANGGMACLGHAVPPGFAWFFRGPVAVSTKTYDVRTDPAAMLTSYQLAAVRLITGKARVVHKQMVSLPPGFNLVLDRGRPSVVWNTGPMIFTDGDLIGTPSWHAHAKDMTDTWLFAGTAEEVFENVSLVMDAHTQPWYGADAVAMVKKSIQARQALPGAALLGCSYFEGSDPEVVFEEQPVPASEYRLSHCPKLVSAWPFKAWTIVLFGDPPATSKQPVTREDLDDQVIVHDFLRMSIAMPYSCTTAGDCEAPGDVSTAKFSPSATCAPRAVDNVTVCNYTELAHPVPIYFPWAPGSRAPS